METERKDTSENNRRDARRALTHTDSLVPAFRSELYALGLAGGAWNLHCRGRPLKSVTKGFDGRRSDFERIAVTAAAGALRRPIRGEENWRGDAGAVIHTARTRIVCK